MGLPNIRVNYVVPFPSRVIGAGPISITKASAVWTVALDFTLLAEHAPPLTQYATTYVVTFNSATGLYEKMTLADLVAAAAMPREVVAAGDVTISNTDTFIALKKTVPANTNFLFPSFTTKIGPVTIWDADCVFENHLQNAVAFGSEKFLTISPYPLTEMGQSTTFTPTPYGWMVK